MDNLPTNPLNTGNGVPPTTPAPAPVAPTPTVPTPITPKPAEPVTSATSTPTAAAQSPALIMEKIMVYKKYIILGVGVIALLVTAYVAYGYFTGISDAITEVKDEATNLNNSLKATTDTTPTDTTTADKEKLNSVVNELKDQYKTDTPTTPPGMKIDLTPTTNTSPDTITPTPIDNSEITSEIEPLDTPGGIAR